MGRSLRSLIACFQLILFCGMLVSNALFMHSHVTGGRIIIHVHPYPLDDDWHPKQHQHSEEDLYRLDFLFTGMFLGGELKAGVDAPHERLLCRLECPQAMPVPFSVLRTSFLRGPPQGKTLHFWDSRLVFNRPFHTIT